MVGVELIVQGMTRRPASWASARSLGVRPLALGDQIARALGGVGGGVGATARGESSQTDGWVQRCTPHSDSWTKDCTITRSTSFLDSIISDQLALEGAGVLVHPSRR